eukprot:Rmarinus@m.14478
MAAGGSVGVFVQHSAGDARFLLGKRKGSHGSGTFALPGGWLEAGESIPETAEREVMEEVGLRISSVSFIGTTNNIMTQEGVHSVTFFTRALRLDDTEDPAVMEPDKCDSWQWTTWQDIVSGKYEPLFLPLRLLVQQWANRNPLATESLYCTSLPVPALLPLVPGDHLAYQRQKRVPVCICFVSGFGGNNRSPDTWGEGTWLGFGDTMEDCVSRSLHPKRQESKVQFSVIGIATPCAQADTDRRPANFVIVCVATQLAEL